MSTEQHLRQVTIGPRAPRNGPINLSPYDADWPAQFARLAQRIHAALGDQILALEHVGSTAIPGMPAKPIIDTVMAVADSADEPSYVPALEAEGFVLRIREPNWFEHRLLKAPEIPGNLHVFSAGCAEIDRMITFRDWLRANDSDRQLYEDTKRELAARTWKYTQDYAEAKTAVVTEIMERAQAAGPDRSAQ